MLEFPNVLVQQAVRDNAFPGCSGRPPLRYQTLTSLQVAKRRCPCPVFCPRESCGRRPQFGDRRPPLGRLHVGPAAARQRPKPPDTGVTATARRRSTRRALRQQQVNNIHATGNASPHTNTYTHTSWHRSPPPHPPERKAQNGPASRDDTKSRTNHNAHQHMDARSTKHTGNRPSVRRRSRHSLTHLQAYDRAASRATRHLLGLETQWSRRLSGGDRWWCYDVVFVPSCVAGAQTASGNRFSLR